eukprot:TRINITY_DN2937_c0_g1::TRINITY_DN2937_c0_g1_i1::g.3942::m.3942 TRINITY_DN2937_c0_g1::TRINITY_DN2937_c0_g1_i1::g.3942  ORF type:complete len:371 (+),score=46.52,sp/Q9ZTP3/EIN4_ARATH/42.02/4e-21,Response_reg/PF00072.19/5.5e-23 TRINITY_DN2937_c0_g1_i1:251-1363(+)
MLGSVHTLTPSMYHLDPGMGAAVERTSSTSSSSHHELSPTSSLRHPSSGDESYPNNVPSDSSLGSESTIGSLVTVRPLRVERKSNIGMPASFLYHNSSAGSDYMSNATHVDNSVNRSSDANFASSTIDASSGLGSGSGAIFTSISLGPNASINGSIGSNASNASSSQASGQAHFNSGAGSKPKRTSSIMLQPITPLPGHGVTQPLSSQPGMPNASVNGSTSNNSDISSSTHSTRASGALIAQTGPRRRVLLMADDDSLNRTIQGKILTKKLGFSVVQAENGIDVLKILEVSGESFDAILMDLLMPEMDGFEATQHINSRWPNHPPIIAMTSDESQATRDRCLALGMAGFIQKPVNIHDMRTALKKAIGTI